jgi:hypothetical protein
MKERPKDIVTVTIVILMNCFLIKKYWYASLDKNKLLVTSNKVKHYNSGLMNMNFPAGIQKHNSQEFQVFQRCLRTATYSSSPTGRGSIYMLTNSEELYEEEKCAMLENQHNHKP